MRILFVIPTLGTGGAERVTTILANHFCQDNDVELFVLEQSNAERYQIDDRVKIKEVCINAKRGNKFRAIVNYVASFAKQRNALKNEILQFQPDTVISFLPKADMLTYSVRKEGRFLWIPSERNDPMARSSVERCVLNFIYRSSDILVCQTKKVAEYYNSKRVKKTHVIRNPLVIKGVSDVEVDVPETYFVAMGRLDKQKNFEMLISAFTKAVKERNCTDKLIILGDGPDRKKLSQQIESLGMIDTILLVGRTMNVNAYLYKAKAFIMSSDYEGMPNAMLEAMAMGLPIISTDFFTGAAREFVDEDNGIVIPVNDERKMVLAIDMMIQKNASELHRMGACSRNRVDELTVENISNIWMQLVWEETKNK